jgi:hypothetical protein
LGGSYRVQAGQAGGQSGRIDVGLRGVPGCFVTSAFGFGQAQQPDFGGDLLGEVR